MNTEPNYSLEARALKYAAVADAGRLRIVDLLTRGDLSSSELQDELGMTSNLLSHHLAVLERCGLVHRHRSDGDRRRSYISLRADAFDGLVPGSTVTARRVVFVCTANSARSQLATALWHTVSSIPAISAGTHPAERIAEGAFKVAAANGLDLPEIAPRSLEGVITGGDYVITVCDSARAELGHLSAAHWSVPDPVKVGGTAAFDRAYRDIKLRVDELAPRLAAA
jgi:ArsR family transcriptional regulator, arsenate/arsenite/antimonite-responsive transcriptional repressor / arsenate reductase (thioredoxin)